MSLEVKNLDGRAAIRSQKLRIAAFFVEQEEKSLDGSNKGARDGRMT